MGSQCGAGSGTTEEGSIACSLCQPGKYSLANSPGCLPCDGGLFQSELGQSHCSVCPKNTYAAPGSAQCTPCPSDKSSAPGSEECISCDAGEFSPQNDDGTDSGAVCLTCPDGKFSFLGGQCIDAPNCVNCADASRGVSVGGARLTFRGGAWWEQGRREIQEVEISQSSTSSTGQARSFTLTLAGSSPTSPFYESDTATAVKGGLSAVLTTVSVVHVTKETIDRKKKFTITFSSSSGDVPKLVGVGDGLNVRVRVHMDGGHAMNVEGNWHECRPKEACLINPPVGASIPSGWNAGGSVKMNDHIVAPYDESYLAKSRNDNPYVVCEDGHVGPLCAKCRAPYDGGCNKPEIQRIAMRWDTTGGGITVKDKSGGRVVIPHNLNGKDAMEIFHELGYGDVEVEVIRDTPGNPRCSLAAGFISNSEAEADDDDDDDDNLGCALWTLTFNDQCVDVPDLGSDMACDVPCVLNYSGVTIANGAPNSQWGYAKSGWSDLCVECKGVWFEFFFAGAFLALQVAIIVFVIRGSLARGDINKSIVVFRIMLMWMQVNINLSMYALKAPGPARPLYMVAKAFDINVLELPFVGCLFTNLTFYNKLIFYMVSPIDAAIIIPGITLMILFCCSRGKLVRMWRSRLRRRRMRKAALRAASMAAMARKGGFGAALAGAAKQNGSSAGGAASALLSSGKSDKGKSAFELAGDQASKKKSKKAGKKKKKGKKGPGGGFGGGFFSTESAEQREKGKSAFELAGDKAGASSDSARVIFIYHMNIFKTCVIVVFFIIFNTTTQHLMQMFDCYPGKIEGSYRLAADLTLECWSAEHSTYLFATIACFIGYSIIIPGIGLSSLWLHRHRLDDPHFERYYGFLYYGYSNVWWTGVVLFRLIVIGAIPILIKDPYVQLFTALLVMVAALAASAFYSPYKKQVLSRIEILSLATTIITIATILLWDYEKPASFAVPTPDIMAGELRDMQWDVHSLVLVALNAFTFFTFCFFAYVWTKPCSCCCRKSGGAAAGAAGKKKKSSKKKNKPKNGAAVVPLGVSAPAPAPAKNVSLLDHMASGVDAPSSPGNAAASEIELTEMPASADL